MNSVDYIHMCVKQQLYVIYHIYYIIYKYIYSRWDHEFEKWGSHENMGGVGRRYVNNVNTVFICEILKYLKIKVM